MMTTLKFLLSFREGVPLSLTKTVNVFVTTLSAAGTIQLRTPVAASIDGPETRFKLTVKLKLFVGKSESTAKFVKIKSAPALTNWFEMGARPGALFDSSTDTENVFATLAGGVPLSVARTVML